MEETMKLRYRAGRRQRALTRLEIKIKAGNFTNSHGEIYHYNIGEITRMQKEAATLKSRL